MPGAAKEASSKAGKLFAATAKKDEPDKVVQINKDRG